ncbi:MAG: hypothetical protein GX751_05315, partial [Desulfuromonadaceae bacterium]|nr:hypothetical protein [Desulfuromonadaceae bacterium]
MAEETKVAQESMTPEADANVEAAAPDNAVILTPPAPGETKTVQVREGSLILTDFDLSAQTIDISGGNLFIEFDNGGVIVLEDFASFADQETSPTFVMADGTMIPSALLLASLTEAPLETASEAQRAGGGIGEYRDDLGTLLDGIDRLGAQDSDTFASNLTQLPIDGQQAPPVVETVEPIPPEVDNPVTVAATSVSANEADLQGGGEIEAGPSAVTGTITVDAPDGLATVTVGGVTVISAGALVPGAEVALAGGVLTFSTFDPATGQLTYNFVLTGSVAHPEGEGNNSLVQTVDVVAADVDGSSDTTTFDVTIVDDVPTIDAAIDADTVISGASVSGTADITWGADGAAAADSITVNGVSGTVDGTSLVFSLANGTLTLAETGAFTFLANANTAATQNFVFAVKDADGDIATDTVSVAISPPQPPPLTDTVTVYEEGLASGSNASATTETATWTAPAGYTIDSITAPGTLGTATIINGELNYTLDAAQTHPAGLGENTLTAADTVTVAIKDSLGNTYDVDVKVDIVDDVPVAADDADSVTEGLNNYADGNVFTGTGGTDANTTDGIADTIGADGAAIAGAVTAAYFGLEADAATATLTTVSGATTINGTYGDLVINNDGSYTYTLTEAAIPTDVTSETFTYQITDGDGDTDLAQLVIALNQDLNVPDVTGDTQTVYEDGLADGTQYGADSETVTGSFTVNANNETYTLTLDGDAGDPVTITAVGQTVTTSMGVLEITSISAPDANGVVTYGYTYTLSAAQTHTGQGEGTALTDTIAMAVTDATGDSDATPGSIVISIVDDVPVAADDADSVTEGLNNYADGNVFTGTGGTDANTTDGIADTIGADGAAI